MGVLPLQFTDKRNKELLGITGHETFETIGLDKNIQPGQTIQILTTREDGSQFTFTALVRLDSVVEVEYFRNGGIMQTVVKKLMKTPAS